MQEADEILIKKIAGNDQSALEELVLRYRNKVLSLIYRYVNSLHDAEELAQDVFVKVWAHAGSFRGNSKLSTWMYRIAVNISLNHLKKKKPAASLDKTVPVRDGEVRKDVAAPLSSQPDSIMAQNSRVALIKSAVESLPPGQKTAFMLSKYEDHPYAEIAEVMNLSVAAVESLLFRAKQNLRKSLLPLREKGEI